ncbi:MAG: hypothetical protein IPL46_33885 [Saprospiraceae bacterium]|nr:hypothetical protein [Saprospiraceae bacterium]
MEEALSKTFTQLEMDTTYQNKLASTNRLELIANKWSDHWATHYYAAYAQMQITFYEADIKNKDAWLDKAEAHLDRAKNLPGAPMDEWEILAANMASSRLSVDPQNRWMKYGPIFQSHLKNAATIEENNPRIYYLRGTDLFYTPAEFGGGPKKAKPNFEKAAALFESEAEDNILDPSQGKGANAYFLSLCNEAIKD